MARVTDFDLDQAALNRLISGPDGDRVLTNVANGVRDRARSTARSISADLVQAIWTGEPQSDAEGPYIDVGYNKRLPGFVLWFHEVGTAKFPASPHLRPALKQG